MEALRGIPRGLERLQLLEQPDAVGDLSRVRGVEKRERGDVAEAECGHRQQHRGEISTGKVRPDTSSTGAGTPSEAKWVAKRCRSMVAEVTMSLRSGRRGSSRLRYPSRKSVLRLRSCASSRTTTE